MDHVEAAPKEHPPGQQELPEQGQRIFDKKTQDPTGLRRLGMTKHMDSVDDLKGFLRVLTFRRDDRNFHALAAQGIRLLPDTPVKGHRKIFDDDEDATARQWVRVLAHRRGIDR